MKFCCCVLMSLGLWVRRFLIEDRRDSGSHGHRTLAFVGFLFRSERRGHIMPNCRHKPTDLPGVFNVRMENAVVNRPQQGDQNDEIRRRRR